MLNSLGTSSERAARATMMLRSELAALKAGVRPANIKDVQRLAALVPEQDPEWRAALFQSFLEDEYGREWVELLINQRRLSHKGLEVESRQHAG